VRFQQCGFSGAVLERECYKSVTWSHLQNGFGVFGSWTGVCEQKWESLIEFDLIKSQGRVMRFKWLRTLFFGCLRNETVNHRPNAVAVKNSHAMSGFYLFVFERAFARCVRRKGAVLVVACELPS
jgi:hypothetical protein